MTRKTCLAVVIALGSLCGLPGCATAPATAPPPPPAREAQQASPIQVSLFDHPWTWTDEQGKPVTFSRWRGQPLVVTAIFTQCKATCPRTVTKLRAMYDRFQHDGRQAQFLLVTLDPAHDTPEALRRFKTSAGFPDTWHLLSGSTADTVELRETLGIHVIEDGPHLLHDGHIMIFDAQGMATRAFGGWSLDEETAL
jgi:protein SCO1/2